MSTNNKNLHLTDQDRIIIEKGIENSSTKAAIALTLVKDIAVPPVSGKTPR